MAQPLAYGLEGQRPYSAVYRHSGKVTFLGTALAAIAGLTCAVIAGVGYAYADLYSPAVKLNLLLCMGFGALLGVVVAGVLRWGKVRNTPVALALIFVITLAAYYVCWDAWIVAVLSRFDAPYKPGLVELGRHPQAMWYIAQELNEIGTWSTSSTRKENEHGVMLWIIWALEGLTIFGIAFVIVKSMMSDLPFCERCNRWCDKSRALNTFNAQNVPAVLEGLKTYDIASLAPFRAGVHEHFVSLTHHTCGECKQLNAVTASEIRITYDRKGKAQQKTKVLLKKLLVSPEELEQLRALQPPSADAGAL